MNHSLQDTIARIEAGSSALWDAVSTAVSDVAGTTVTFSQPVILGVYPNEASPELASTSLTAQFAFANLPEETLVISLTNEAFAALIGLADGEVPETLEEGNVADVRPILEAMVQGLCLGFGAAKGEPIVAGGLTVRYGETGLPNNLNGTEEVLRLNVPFTFDSFSGTLSVFMSQKCAQVLSSEDGAASSGIFAQLGATASDSISAATALEEQGLEIIMDIPLDMSVELGRVKLPVRDVIELGAGSIVELDKAAGEPVDVMVNGRLVARGEVVVIDDNFGVRITEILSVQERLMKLNEAA